MLVSAPPVWVQLVRADARVQAAVTRWDGRGAVPDSVVAPVLREQLIELRLAHDARLYRVVIAKLPKRLRRDVVDDVVAHRELASLSTPQPLSTFRIGPALRARRLLALYREAQRRFGVAWQLLAAINDVESDFGRVREASSAGAQGPMQFIPATWAEYGHGDVHDPRAAILAAGRFLRAAGALRDERAALYRYNPSRAYADAVARLAARIRRDPAAFLVLFARRLIVRTPHGLRRLTAYAAAPARKQRGRCEAGRRARPSGLCDRKARRVGTFQVLTFRARGVRSAESTGGVRETL